jgi:hypothetical protein
VEKGSPKTLPNVTNRPIGETFPHQVTVADKPRVVGGLKKSGFVNRTSFPLFGFTG